MRIPEPTAPTERTRADPLLVPFLSAPSDEVAREPLRRVLAGVAEPVIRAILSSRFRPSGSARGETLDDDALEGARSDATARIVARLWELRTCPDREPIHDFQAYVAVACYRACDRHLAAKYPERFRLRNRLRITLTETEGFALWTGDEGWLCGYADWQLRKVAPDRKGSLRRLQEEPDRLRRHLPPGEGPADLTLPDLVAALFDYAGQPVGFEDLVGAVAGLTGTREAAVEPLVADGEWGTAERDVIDAAPGLDEVAESREVLRRLLAEIHLLPWRQRMALLLNLRGEDRRDGIALFPLTGVASRAEIAGILEMEPDDFTDLWDGLPLEDAAIAVRLGCTRQQVIGLRDAARRRLRRRLAAQEMLPIESGKRMNLP